MEYIGYDIKNQLIQPKDIDFTMIVAEESRKKVGSTLGRAAVGALALGPVGLLAGVTGKNKRTTTFLVKYKNGSSSNHTVETDSHAFEQLCKYLR